MTEREHSTSPHRRSSWTRGVSVLGAKFGIGLTNVDENGTDQNSTREADISSLITKVGDMEVESRDTVSTISKDRSVSRGRDSFQSSGRGGAGNIRRASASKEPASPVATGRDTDLCSPVRGREPGVEREKSSQTQAIGRGGVGNIRSRSRARATSKVTEGHPQTASILSEAAATNAEYERNVIQASQDAAKAVQRTGRGGVGNITTSRSRSRGPNAIPVHSTGRGGRGNIQSGYALDAEEAELLDEVERLRLSHDGGVHSTGRGGLANITSLHSPPPESVPLGDGNEWESMGRGGAGNIRSRSASREPGGYGQEYRSRSASKDRHGISKIWNKVTRTASRDAHEERGRSTTVVNGTIAEDSTPGQE